MRETVTISVPAAIRKQLTKAAKADGVTQSEFVRKALKTELFRRSLRAARAELLVKARAKGIYTDDDVFKAVS
jgi:metal-responsive CopG/Arc/MetJ family transcriptional regulator